jgi:aminoglycoside phosphotransferase
MHHCFLRHNIVWVEKERVCHGSFCPGFILRKCNVSGFVAVLGAAYRHDVVDGWQWVAGHIARRAGRD